MLDITIKQVENGYIVQQQMKGYDYRNSWVAESISSLLRIIEQLCKKEGDQCQKND